MYEDDYDDLGVRNGLQFDDFGGAARQALREWSPIAFGQRPIDWAKRDLHLGRPPGDSKLLSLPNRQRSKPLHLSLIHI